MKKLLILPFVSVMMLMSTAVNAQSWASLYKEGNATYVGGFYAAVSYACLKTDYTNDSGYWASGDANIPYTKGCASAIFSAMFGNVETPKMPIANVNKLESGKLVSYMGDFDILHYNVGKS